MHLWLSVYFIVMALLILSSCVEAGVKPASSNPKEELRVCSTILSTGLFWPIILVVFVLLSAIYIIILMVRKCYSYFKK